ncbi:Citrate synthase (si) [Prochlorococcus sp. SS52]|uniref:Citrate synthase n=2 Tax=Prochlorococcaceae TaxID=2881426 RepID=Q7VE29_PROMA|nr:Citrate synthase [Prochlorococcus marinus subsp. marinus str. CCMP1375]KGG11500.1 Citrate synthase (si) [Prochlorococcus marinus str. LG]KGG18546.1 Citrate synthase (si) [Prochlorococcus marinus str. SS2]KGG22819.1 Citrate synthase (si) [Prochlorococcus marinus str. SS35]KGG32695.1 Citrate synthase (si) [Prochlorococcus marinus str. SS51]KGG37123.1 Citrate synthase (si) [Prochlorococcus sp. SS52]
MEQKAIDNQNDPCNMVLKPGLEGVPVTQSAICDINGLKGELKYRGYSIAELAAKSSFLETTYLLIWGDLPSSKQLREFEDAIQMHRRLSFRVRDMMKCFPATGHPMDALQSSAASLGLFYSRRAIDNPQYIYDAVVRLIAKIPTMVAAFQLIRKGQDPIQPRDDLPYSANFLYMLTEREPDPLAARVFDRCLILHAEHSLNASTFSARVTASTLTDPYAVVASAVGTLAGPLHGGANEDVIAMLEEIGAPENARNYLKQAIDQKSKIMGFGHREYKVKDPRATLLQGFAEDLFARFGKDEMYDVARSVEEEASPLLGPRGIYPNVDFYSGLVYRKLGIPRDLFTPIFAISRVAGWLAHWREQLSANRIFRPTQIYTGKKTRAWCALEERNKN